MADEPLLIHAAAEATRLLGYFGVTEPAEICVEDIAAGLDVEVKVAPLEGAEAHLVRVGEVGTITVSDQLKPRGVRRFAIAHELGHWRLHQHISQNFFCSAQDLREYRSSGPELEANTFASELLIPKSMIPRTLLSREPDWSIIQHLTTTFDVGPVAAAVRYADLSAQPIMSVFSDGRNVKWWRENRRVDGLWLESAQSISEDAIAYHQTLDRQDPPQVEQVPWDVWFPHISAHEDAELFEMSAAVDDIGTVVSILWIPSW